MKKQNVQAVLALSVNVESFLEKVTDKMRKRKRHEENYGNPGRKELFCGRCHTSSLPRDACNYYLQLVSDAPPPKQHTDNTHTYIRHTDVRDTLNRRHLLTLLRAARGEGNVLAARCSLSTAAFSATTRLRRKRRNYRLLAETFLN